MDVIFPSRMTRSVAGLRHYSRIAALFVSMVVYVLLFPAMPAAAQSSPDQQWDYANLAAAVDRLEQRLQRVQQTVNQTRFDADEMVFSLDFDDEAIVEFVNANIVFHPYEGLLRGIGGTLQSRAGNSLDQSLLLAYLLKSAGLDARIVRGELTPTQTTQLLGQTRQAPEETSLAYLADTVEQEFGETAVQAGEPIDVGQTKLGHQAKEAVAMLEKQLGEAGRTPRAESISDELIRQLGEYFWIEYRDGPGRDWQAAHPAFGADPGFEIEPLEYMAEKIPERYHHRLTMEAFLRQRQLDKHKTHRLMTAFTRPVANLHGVVLSYRNNPNGLKPETLSDLDNALDDRQILTPIFRGGMAPGAMAFDLKGRVIDPTALGSQVGGAAGLFAELSDKMESATANLADPDDPKTVFELDSMWLEFTLESPSGETRTQRRYLLPPAGDNERTPADLVWPLISEYAYVVNAGDMSLDYLADRYLQTGITSLETYKALAHKLIKPDEGTPMPETPPQDFGPLALYKIMASDPFATADVVPVRHRPAVVGLKRGLRDADTAFSAVDIVFNDMLQLRRDGEALHHYPAAALRRGVWETAVETLPGTIRRDDIVSRSNTMSVFEQAKEQGIDLQVLGPNDPGAAAALDMDSGARALLQQDLSNGFSIVVPARTPDGLEQSGWWRIDPVTGTTLGMTADGHGQDAVEYIIDNTLTAISLIQAIGGLAKCEEEEDDVQKMCCLVETHINNVGGLAFGGILGGVMGSSAATLFGVLDLQTQMVTGAVLGESQGLMPQADIGCQKLQGTNW